MQFLELRYLPWQTSMNLCFHFAKSFHSGKLLFDKSPEGSRA